LDQLVDKDLVVKRPGASREATRYLAIDAHAVLTPSSRREQSSLTDQLENPDAY
jgi:hypothetical protein